MRKHSINDDWEDALVTEKTTTADTIVIALKVVKLSLTLSETLAASGQTFPKEISFVSFICN